MNLKLGLPPVIAKSSTILILGTMPGDDSLRLQQYYAHGKNQFWRILTAVYREAIGTDYSQRITFLHKKGLALWDVLQSAEREGSLNSDIKNETANDFSELLAANTRLKAIVFNGGKSQALFRRYVEKANPFVASRILTMIALPSSSPTPGRNVLSFEDKIVRWQALLAQVTHPIVGK